MEQFVIAPRRQREWGWLMVLAFFFEGVGGGVFLISAIALDNLVWGLLAGLLIVAVGAGGALLLDLGKPLRFWRVISRPNTSWLSRGTFFLAFFVLFSFLYVLPFAEGLSDLPWRQGTTAGDVIKILAVIAALATMLYAGFVLSYSPAIPFWNTALLPVLFGLYSAIGGAAVVYLMLPTLAEGSVDIEVLQSIQVALLLGALLLIAVYLATQFFASVAAKASVRSLLTGGQLVIFTLGVLIAGLIVPVTISATFLVAEVSFDTAAPVLAAMGILVLAGGYLFRYSLIKVGMYAPYI